MDKIYICSPYRGDTRGNLEKVKRYCSYEDKLLDINDYMFDMDVYKRIIPNNKKGGFKIVFW